MGPLVYDSRRGLISSRNNPHQARNGTPILGPFPSRLPGPVEFEYRARGNFWWGGGYLRSIMMERLARFRFSSGPELEFRNERLGFFFLFLFLDRLYRLRKLRKIGLSSFVSSGSVLFQKLF